MSEFTAIDFIGAIKAVGSSVTLPAAVDALPATTAELQRGAPMSRRSGQTLGAAVLGPLVRAVQAVGVSVAGPEARNTDGVVALEGRGAAGDAGAGRLVAAVVAVGLVVAHERGRHALAVGAAELGVCALLGC